MGHIEVRLRRRRNGREHADEDELSCELEELEPDHKTDAATSKLNSIAQAFKKRALPQKGIQAMRGRCHRRHSGLAYSDAATNRVAKQTSTADARTTKI